MKKTDNFVFRFLQVVSWIIFIGLCIEAGGLLVNFMVALLSPESVSQWYINLNLGELLKADEFSFYGSYLLILAVAFFKAYLFCIVVKLSMKWDVNRPFNDYVASRITRIAYFALIIGLLCLITQSWIELLVIDFTSASALYAFISNGQAFVMLGTVIYIISAIFKKGLEVQSEKDLTV